MRKTKKGDGIMENRIYTIQVLEDKDYDTLDEIFPNIKKEDLRNSLGFADVKKGEAYVRKTNVATLDETTMQHELQELLAKTSPDEIDGIRWKKGMDIITPIFQAVATITGHPYLAAAAGAARGAYKQATDQGTLGQTLISTAAPLVAGALGAGQAGGAAYTAARTGTETIAKQGIIGSMGQALKAGTGQLLGMTPAAAAPATGELAKQFATQQATQFGTPLTLGGQTSLVTGGAGGLSAVPQVLGSAIGAGLGSQLAQAPKVATTPVIQGAGQITPAVTPAVTPAPAAAPFSLKSLVTPQNILGAGSLLASTGVKQPEFVMPESVEAIRSKLLQTGAEGGLTEVGQQARLELGNIMKATPEQLYAPGTDVYYQNTLRNLENEYARQKKALAQQWNAIDPNYQYNGEYIMADDRLNKSYMEVRNSYVSQEEQRRFELGRTQKYLALQEALGVDKNVMDDLVGLTGLDVQTAAMMYGAQVQDVQQIRESLGTLGVELLLRGQGIQKQGAININLGQ